MQSHAWLGGWWDLKSHAGKVYNRILKGHKSIWVSSHQPSRFWLVLVSLGEEFDTTLVIPPSSGPRSSVSYRKGDRRNPAFSLWAGPGGGPLSGTTLAQPCSFIVFFCYPTKVMEASRERRTFGERCSLPNHSSHPVRLLLRPVGII